MERKKASDFPPEVSKLFDGYVHGSITRRDFLERAECSVRIGAVGFCFGGGVVNQMAVRIPDLAAAVPFYGSQPATSDVGKIKAALQIHYAEHDERINNGWPAFEQALKANKVRYEMHMYPNAQHAFHNDTTPRYDEAAAKLAWQRTVDFFNKHLRT
jgi:carboxymethylenebutenolidase